MKIAGKWLMGAVGAVVLAALLGVMIFAGSYYETHDFNEQGYWRYSGFGFYISFWSAFLWSAIACLVLWTIGLIGYELKERY